MLIAVVIAAAAELAWTEADGRIEFHNTASLHDFDGRVATFAGQVDAERGTGELVVPARALGTGIGSCDSRLLNYCLEVQCFPEIRFALRGGKSLVDAAGSGRFPGTLTVRDVSHALDLPLSWAWEGPNLHLKGRLDMSWADWNIPDPSILLSRLDPTMSVTFDVVARPPATQEAPQGAPR